MLTLSLPKKALNQRAFYPGSARGSRWFTGLLVTCAWGCVGAPGTSASDGEAAGGSGALTSGGTTTSGGAAGSLGGLAGTGGTSGVPSGGRAGAGGTNAAGGATTSGGASGGLPSGEVGGGLATGGSSGGSENSGGAPGAGGSLPATFATIGLLIQTSFDRNAGCGTTTCHGGRYEPELSWAGPKNDATLYQALTTQTSPLCGGAVLVVPGEPASSALVKILKGECDPIMGTLASRMPLSCDADPEFGNCITPDQIAVIEQWIADGAQH
jgi:hypothetical protein